MATRRPKSYRPRLEALETRETPSLAMPGAALAPRHVPSQTPVTPTATTSPFQGRGQAFLVSRNTKVPGTVLVTLSNLAGAASQIGRFTAQLTSVFAKDPLHFIATTSLIAPNLDVVNLQITGTFDSTKVTSHFNGTFEITGGTGRFAFASGSGIIRGFQDSRIKTTAFVFHGTIILPPKTH